MATGKVYYWLKLKKDFLESDTMDFLMSQDNNNGAKYFALYMMLCMKTINTNGMLASTMGDIIMPFDIGKIERDCKWFSADTIKVGMKLFEMLGLIHEADNGFLQISGFNELVGSETDFAKQKRVQRENKNYGQLVDNTVDNVHTEIRDKSTEIRDKSTDKEIEKEKKKRQAKPAEPAIYFKNDEKLNEAFLAFIADRKERHKAMSSRSIKMAVEKLNDLSRGDNDLAIKIINQSIEKGWMTFYPLKNDNGRYQRSSSRDEWAEIFEEARREDMNNEQRGSSENSIYP